MFAATWFVLWLAPVLAALRVFFSVHAVLERYLYVPSIGICLAVAMGIEWIAARRALSAHKHLLRLGLASALTVIFMVTSIEQNAVWKDQLTLYRHCVEVSPEAPLAHTALSTELFKMGRYEEAEAEAGIARAIDPHCIDAYMNLAYFSGRKGDYKAAVDYLQQAKLEVREGPLKLGELATVCTDMAHLNQQLKQYDLAEQNLVESTKLLPSAPSVWENLGNLIYDQGRYQEAVEMFQKAAQSFSRTYAPIHLELARTYDHLNNTADARREYESYLSLAPQAPDAEEVRRRLGRL
jgi:tetratricopeptide (TPR) repeat protein